MHVPAGLPRRLAAAFYDLLIIVALWFAATALLLPFTGGEAVPAGGAIHYLHQLYLLGVTYVYFGWFWTHSGQTTGMKAWRLRVIREDGRAPTWRDTALRFGAAMLSWLPLGLGYFWALWDAEQRTWHDRLSRTRLVVLPKRR